MLRGVFPEQAGRREHRPPRHVLLRRVAELVRRSQQDALQVVQVCRLSDDLQEWQLTVSATVESVSKRPTYGI